MKKYLVFLFAISLFSNQGFAQNAPVTTIGSVAACPVGIAILPVTVSACSGIGSISLRLEYNPNLLTFSDTANVNSSLAGIIINDVHVSASLHKIMIVWGSVTPVSFSAGSKLLDLKFTYISGSPVLSFNNTSNVGGDCEYTDAVGNPLNDLPSSIYYISGQVSSNQVGAAGVITGLTSLCQGRNSVIYTVPSITNATGYVWTLPSGASIASGGNTNTINVNYSNTATSGNINVYGTNSCGNGTVSPDLAVTVNHTPVPDVYGPVSVCSGSSGVPYSTEAGMTNYIWSAGALGGISSGQGTNSIIAAFEPLPATTPISVTYTNSSGCTGATSVLVSLLARPTPTISGPSSVCYWNSNITYSTEPGMIGYSWSISPGGMITSALGTNEIIVTWIMEGVQTISVNYKNSNGCYAANPTIKNVTVNPLPVPTINGIASTCAGTTGVIYSTESGMSNYTWTVSSGGTVTSGSATNQITVNWNTAGAQVVSVNYTNNNGCTASSATNKNVTVKSLPVPYITGPSSPCQGSSETYRTSPSQTNYVWTVSPGGSVYYGGTATDYTIGVIWNNTGPQSVSVSYTDQNGCTAVSPTVYPVTVNPLPSPSITGPLKVCVNSSGNVYKTQPGQSNYAWTISSGGIITGGEGTDSVTVTWNVTGVQYIRVNYDNSYGCAGTPAISFINVDFLPVPWIEGQQDVCIGSSGMAYMTQSGMTNYVWNISSGGTITSGGTTNTISVNWNTAGPQTVSVSYTNSLGCTSLPVSKNIIVHPLPVPVISGPVSVCSGSQGVAYNTDPGMYNYYWTVGAWGFIGSGQGTNSITVNYAPYSASNPISVSYNDSYGCSGTKTLAVILLPRPAPSILGVSTVCQGSTGITYTTEVGMTGYTWSVTSGGTITSGAGTNQVTIAWTTSGAQTVSVNYTGSNGCAAANPATFNVTVNPYPVPTITGAASVCEGASGITYSTEAGMSNYIWTVSSGGSITSGAGTNSITVSWLTAGSQSLMVNYNNSNNCSASSPSLKWITVNPLPVPTITGPGLICAGTSGHVYITEYTMNGYSWNISDGGTITSGANTSTVNVAWNTAGQRWINVIYTDQHGCTANPPSQQIVNVKPYFQPVITGSSTICQGATNVVYSTATDFFVYTWTISPGGTITSGSGTNQIAVSWNSTGVQWVRVNYMNAYGCLAPSPTQFDVTVITNPSASGSITGTSQVQQGQSGVVYSVSPVPGATGYEWTLTPGASIASGANTNAITVNYSLTATAGNISVHGTNSCGSGAESPLFPINFGHDISGTFIYNNSANTPLDSVRVYLIKSGLKLDSTFTSSAGNYIFQSKANDTYTIQATTKKPWSSVNGTDALKVQRHFAGLEILTIPIRLAAADVNNNNYINATDALKIKRRFAGLDTYFDRGDWVFQKISGGDTIIVNGALVTQDFYGLCVGDVNGSNNPGTGAKSLSLVDLIQDYNVYSQTGVVIEVPVKVSRPISVGAISLVLNYPAELMEIIDIGIKQGNLTYKAQNGTLRLAWSEINPMPVSGEEAILKLKIRLSDNFLPGSEIRFSLDQGSEINDTEGTSFDNLSLFMPVIISRQESGNGIADEEFASLSVYPNPTNHFLNIDYQLQAPGQIRVELITMLGQSVMIHDSWQEYGAHQLKSDISQFEPGVYSLVISYEINGKKSKIYKMIVISK